VIVVDESDLSDLNCSIPQFFNREPCSGNGVCDPSTGLCECFPGWTGRSDIFNTEGRDCQINEMTIKILWAMVLTISLATIVPVFRRFQERWAHFQNVQQAKTQNGRKSTLFKNKGLVTVLFHGFGLFPSTIFLAILKLARPTGRIGIDWPETLAFMLVRIFIGAMLAVFQPALIKTFLRGSRSKTITKQKSLIEFSERFASANFMVCVIASFIPFGSISTRGEPSVHNLSVLQAYFAIGGLYIFFLIIQAVYVHLKASRMLQKAYELTMDSSLLEVKKKIAKTELEGIFHATWQTTTFAALLGVPSLYNKHDYVVAIFFSIYPVVGLNFANTYVNTSSASSDSGTSSKVDASPASSVTVSKPFESIEETSKVQEEIETISPAPPPPRNGKETLSERFKRATRLFSNQTQDIEDIDDDFI